MQKVSVRGADGERAILAFVRRDEHTTYACAIPKYNQVKAGDEEPIVGFPTEDTELLS